MNYTFVVRTSLGGAQWLLAEQHGSDASAIERAKHLAANLESWRSFMGIDVYGQNGSEDYVAFVSVQMLPSFRVAGLKPKVSA